MIRADISKEERLMANKIAKTKGYTFQGWIGNLIKSEIQKAKEVRP